MIDKIEMRIAQELADRHFYPFGVEIYNNIFKHFSHFPLNLSDIGLQGEGKTITFLALVVLECFNYRKMNFTELYHSVLEKLQKSAAQFFPQPITVETYLGCLIYYYHPVDIKSIFSQMDVDFIFDKEEKYEFELKKKTILLFAL